MVASTSVRWSVYAGTYAFVAGVALSMPLGIITETLVQVLTLPRDLATTLVPGSGGVIGAVVWWVAIERRGEYTLTLGGVVGLVTALVTVVLWTLLVALAYGLGVVPAAAVVVLFVSAVTAPVGFLAGVSLMYLRRRSVRTQSDQRGPTPE